MPTTTTTTSTSTSSAIKALLLPLLSGLFAALGSALTKYTLNWPSLYAFIAILLCNLLMWFTYTKSLSNASSINVMSLNTLGNILFSGIFGLIIFGEQLSLRWLQGASMLILGVYVINYF